MSLKLSLFYDIACPRSWVFYQVLQKKLPKCEKHRQLLQVHYLPVNSFFIHKQTYGIYPTEINANKKDYMLQELYDICSFYEINKGNFEIEMASTGKESRIANLLLNVIRKNKPEYYEKFIGRIMYNFWHKSEHFNHTSNCFKLGRELGVRFEEMDRLVMQMENFENILDIGKRNLHLSMEERITEIPWFRVDSIPGDEKLIGFTEIIRLELLDELMTQPFFNPLNHNIDNALFLNAVGRQNAHKESEKNINEREDEDKRRWKSYISIKNRRKGNCYEN